MVNTDKFKIVKNANLVTDGKLSEIFKNPGFGIHFTDHMAHIHYEANADVPEHSLVNSTNGVWKNHAVIPFANLELSPAASVFHYGQEVFEGIKAFRRKDGSIWAFRFDRNATRFNDSAVRLGLPDLPIEDFEASIAAVVKQDQRWVPSGEGEALYIRPFMIATEPFLGVRASHIVDYYCILSPVGNYFGTPKPVDIWVESKFFRAGPGGTGFAKCGGNYAASLLPGETAASRGFNQVLYLDARDENSVEELGGMSFFAVYEDGHALTPKLNGQILDSVTRDSIIQVLKDRGIEVIERQLGIDELIDDIKCGRVVEAFACGTAAVVAPIGRLAGDARSIGAFDVQIGNDAEGALTRSLRDEIVGIQRGEIADLHNWCTKLV